MRPTSERLRSIVQSTHTARGRVTVCAVPNDFYQSLTPPGLQLDVLDGDVRMDSSAVIRSTIDVTVAARWGYLLPNGSELFVEYGVEVAGGRFEWTALGYFRIETVTEVGLGQVRVTGSDRMAQVAESESFYPYVAPASTTHQDFYSSLLYGRPSGGWFHAAAGAFPSYAGQSIISDYSLTSNTIGQQTVLENPYAEHMADLATRYSKRLFFDYRGRLNIVSDTVAPAATPVRTVAAGQPGGVRELRRQVTREGVYTSVAVTGDKPTEGNPPFGWRYLGDNLNLRQDQWRFPSGLSWFHEFGRIVKRYSSPLLLTGDQCDKAALTLLNKIEGLPYTLSFKMPADPTLEVLDTIGLSFPEQPPDLLYPPIPGMRDSVTTENHVLDTLVFPLTGGDMAVTTRGGVMRALLSDADPGRRP